MEARKLVDAKAPVQIGEARKKKRGRKEKKKQENQVEESRGKLLSLRCF